MVCLEAWLLNIYQCSTEDEVRKADKSEVMKSVCVMLRRRSFILNPVRNH